MPAPKGNQYAKGNKGGGNKPIYTKKHAEIAYKLCLLGATDEKIADILEVSVQTINNWKKKHKEFGLALKKGKEIADAEVANALYNRAKGYVAPDIVTATYEGKITDVMHIEKHYPPDTGAAMAWLKCRQPDKWRDKQQLEITNFDATKAMTKAERQAKIDELLKKKES